MPILPPVEQTFTINARAFMAGIDEMIAATDRLAESLNLATGSTERMSAVADSVTATESRVTETITANTAAFERQGIAVDALIQESRDLAIAVDEAAAAIDRENIALDTTIASAGKADVAAAGVGGHGKMAFLGIAAAVTYSVVKAAEYQSQMATLLTQAGVAKSQFAGLKSGVLSLAGQVGFAPTSLAAALYHIESSFASIGITGPKALNLLRIAAEGAQVGHANLVDVTNALDATIASGVGGVRNYSQAMGALNAIVGSGDMTMQDLADAMGTGAMAQAKLFGQSIYQVGAALATLGDNNIRGAKAATDLRMTWQAIQSPMKAGIPILAQLGLQAGTLANTMTHHGLTAALAEFVGHLKASKVPLSDWGQIITQIFGKRAGTGIGVLTDQLGRLQGKLPDLKRGADGFGQAWKTTQATVGQQFKEFKANLDALAVSFGSVLLPPVLKIMTAINKFLQIVEHNAVLRTLAGAIVAVAVAMGVMTAAGAALDAVLSVNPIMLVIVAVVALAAGLYELYKHCALVRRIVADVVQFFKTAWADAMHVAGAVVQWFVNGPLAFIKAQIAQFTKFWKQNHAEIMKIVKAAWDTISAIVKTAWAIILGVLKAGLAIFEALFKAGWEIAWTIVKTVWHLIAEIVSTSIHEVLDIISIVLDLLQGHWSAAWNKVKDLVSTVWHEITNVTKTVLGALITIVWDLGKAIIEGLINGMKAMIGGLIGAVKSIAGGVVSAFKDVLHIFSPSRVFYDLGTMITAGLGAGITETASKATNAARRLAQQVQAAYNSGQITKSEYYSLEARITKDLRTHLNGLQKFMRELGLELNKQLMAGLAGTASQVKSSIDKLLTMVKDAWLHGDITYPQASKLTKFIENDNTRLERLATKRANILKTIATAQKYATTTTQNVESWASLSNAVSSMPQGGGISGAGLLASLQGDLATINRFNAAIKKLAALGLNKNLLNQIIQAGPTDGLQLADALLAGPVSTIKQLNSTEQQIETASTSIGQSAANAMYDTGKQAGKGFLSGLEAQQKSIEALMEKIADAMIKRLDKALGIKGGESEPHKRGKKIAKDIADGMTDNLHLVKGATDRLLGKGYSPRSGGAGGAGGGNAYKVDININFPHGLGVIDAQTVRDLQPVIQKAILQLEGRNPTPQTTRSRAA